LEVPKILERVDASQPGAIGKVECLEVLEMLECVDTLQLLAVSNAVGTNAVGTTNAAGTGQMSLFPSEKLYSPTRLMCCQETAEPLATASRSSRTHSRTNATQ